MSHDITDEKACGMVPYRKHLEKIPGQSRNRNVAVAEMKSPAPLAPWNHGIFVGQKGLLNLAGEGQFLFHLIVALLQGRRGLCQRLLGSYKFRDITGDAEGPDDLAYPVDQRHFGGQDPGLSSFRRRLLLDIAQNRVPAIENLLLIPQGLVSMVLPEEIMIALPNNVLRTPETVPLRHRSVHQRELRFPILEIDIEGNIIDEQTHEVALFQKLLLRQLARGDVDHRPCHPHSPPLRITNHYPADPKPMPVAFPPGHPDARLHRQKVLTSRLQDVPDTPYEVITICLVNEINSAEKVGHFQPPSP